VSTLAEHDDLLKQIINLTGKDRFTAALVGFLQSRQLVASYARTLDANRVEQIKEGPYKGLLIYRDPKAPDDQQIKVVVPNITRIKMDLWERHHADLCAGHPGRQRTLDSLKRYYIWPQMEKDVREFCKQCQVCQFVKAQGKTTKPSLQPLPIPKHPWEVISMDFVGPLPRTSRNNQQILVVVDKYTKFAYFLPAKLHLKAPDVADLLLTHVYRNHGLPRAIISDRDGKFTSNFWESLLDKLDIRAMMSTAYHPATDGQTERINRVMVDMIRCFCDKHLSNWDKLLIPLEMAYNDSVSSSTRHTPFYLNYGRHPRTPKSLCFPLQPTDDSPVEPSASLSAEHHDNLVRAHKEAEYYMEVAKKRMKHYADRHRKSPPAYKPGDKVLVATSNLSTSEGNSFQKLHLKWIGPFTIVKTYPDNPSIVRLDLDGSNHSFYAVVNVERIKPYVDSMIIPDLDAELERLYGSTFLPLASADRKGMSNTPADTPSSADQDPIPSDQIRSDPDKISLYLDKIRSPAADPPAAQPTQVPTADQPANHLTDPNYLIDPNYPNGRPIDPPTNLVNPPTAVDQVDDADNDNWSFDSIVVELDDEESDDEVGQPPVFGDAPYGTNPVAQGS